VILKYISPQKQNPVKYDIPLTSALAMAALRQWCKKYRDGGIVVTNCTFFKTVCI
jgi:hypothetical protein